MSPRTSLAIPPAPSGDALAPLRALTGPSRAGQRLARLLASPAAFRASAALDVELALAGHEGAVSLLVASHARSEGRSTVAIILAAHAALADAGRRVLLVDADTTPGSAGLSTRLGLAAGMPGLLDHLHRGVALADLPVTTQLANLSVLPLGAHGGLGVRVASGRLEKALRDLRGIADIVVVDAMACAAGRDVLIAARAVQNVVMVVRQAGPASEEVLGSVQELEGAGANVLGCVLNQFRPLLPWPFRTLAERGLA